VDVAAGNEHLLVPTELGDVYACGVGDVGQLGRRIIKRHEVYGTLPEKIVLGSRSRKAVLIRAGGFMSFAIDTLGYVWAWGINGEGQTGTGVSNPEVDRIVHAPKKVIGLSKDELGGEVIVDIAAGDFHAVFLTDESKFYACGDTRYGRLGLANDDPALAEVNDEHTFVPIPTLVSFPDPDDPVQQISATNGTMAVTSAGALYAWGSSPSEELGLDGEDTTQTPKMIVRKEGGSWAAVGVACGGQHSVALMRKK
jgi:regulator of chromosome condensation